VPRVFTEFEAIALDLVCERIVPGSVATGAPDYVDRIAQARSAADFLRLRAAIAALAAAVDDDERFAELVTQRDSAEIRGLVIEAYYGDYAPPGHTGQTGWQAIGFNPPQASRLAKDWSFIDERTAG
jgi:hypothetical protein